MKADRLQLLLKSTRARLKAAADPKFEAECRWFFKEPVNPYGVRTPKSGRLARTAYGEVKLWPVAERDRFVTELWKSGMLEEGVLVSHLYRRFAKIVRRARDFGCSNSGWIVTSGTGRIAMASPPG